MAVNKTINKRTNTHGAMRNCMLEEYVQGIYVYDDGRVGVEYK